MVALRAILRQLEIGSNACTMVSTDPLITAPDTIKALTAWGEARLRRLVESPRLDAELLLAFAMGASRSMLLAWPERLVKAAPSAAIGI